MYDPLINALMNFCKKIEEFQCKTMRTFALSDEFFQKGLESRTLENTYQKEKLIVKVSKIVKLIKVVGLLICWGRRDGGKTEKKSK